ncbi:phosphoethanolamine transferase [Rosenbergiella australiborealis]|uniref:Phosphoethanolamine transferase n=1 Tax=Rosenbergiella australiborealis TaxID=1544696 RepID=A0ABS5T630_9GAMM|nr:phosphoethanolamine transferase [Rosenbergiella australiborealis]MBT0727801.1 phosphoethanolamine transferase [Rosenbergiella australiborealis]
MLEFIKNKLINGTYVTLFVLLFISVMIPVSLGYNNVWNCFLTLTLLQLARISRLLQCVLAIILFLLSFYIPIGIQFGRMNYGFVISAIETDYHETKEFLKGILGLPLLLLFISWAALYYYITLPVYKLRRKILLVLGVLFFSLAINSYPKRMIKNFVGYIIQSKKDLTLLKDEALIPDTFTDVSSHPRYKNIIIIIGESVAANYLSLYNYPHNNTPWLKTAPGFFLENYISTAPNTFLSLPRTLALSDGDQVTFNNNVVTLANRAGYDTYWISNQGFVGEYDTPATVIAMRAKHRIFLKRGDYNSALIDDFTMLKFLPDILSKEQKKVIFIHMIGSHPDTCERVIGYPQRFTVSDKQEINCYLASINKLDEFVHKVYDYAKDAQSPFVLTYFSDHGMTVDSGRRPVRHGGDEKQNYHVPFFIITDTATVHKTIDTPVSAYQFPNIFATLAGITSRQIIPLRIADIRPSEIKVFNGKEKVNYQQLSESVLIK